MKCTVSFITNPFWAWEARVLNLSFLYSRKMWVN
jgi:hypothetical protein